MSKKSQNFQTSSKFHRLNRRKDGIFSCMRSARVDWGKSHRQITNFSRGLRFRAKICIFSTRKRTKIIRFEFYRTFRRAPPPERSQNCRSDAKLTFFARSLLLFTKLGRPRRTRRRGALRQQRGDVLPRSPSRGPKACRCVRACSAARRWNGVRRACVTTSFAF